MNQLSILTPVTVAIATVHLLRQMQRSPAVATTVTKFGKRMRPFNGHSPEVKMSSSVSEKGTLNV